MSGIFRSCRQFPVPLTTLLIMQGGEFLVCYNVDVQTSAGPYDAAPRNIVMDPAWPEIRPFVGSLMA